MTRAKPFIGPMAENDWMEDMEKEYEEPRYVGFYNKAIWGKLTPTNSPVIRAYICGGVVLELLIQDDELVIRKIAPNHTLVVDDRGSEAGIQ